MSAIGKAAKGIVKIAAPIVGGALGGPFGAAAGGMLGGLLGGNSGPPTTSGLPPIYDENGQLIPNPGGAGTTGGSGGSSIFDTIGSFLGNHGGQIAAGVGGLGLLGGGNPITGYHNLMNPQQIQDPRN